MDHQHALDQQPDLGHKPDSDEPAAAEAAQPGRWLLTVTAVIVGVIGLALVAAGWWFQDWQYSPEWRSLQDRQWWAGAIVRGLGQAMLNGLGFKLALACVAGSLGLLGWVRKRR